MRHSLRPAEAEEAAKLEPIIAKMKPEQARNLAIALDSFVIVMNAMRKLTGEIEDSSPMEDNDIVRYTEGMAEPDSAILREWLKKTGDAIQEAYEAMPLNKDRLYESLSTTAMDVYYDHQRAEEEAEEIAVRE